MKNLIFIVCVTLTWNAVVGSNSTEDGNQNKTKRGIIDQTHYYGEPVTIKYIQTPIIHHDSNAAPATNFNFNNAKPIVFHNSNAPNAPNEPPKQVTVEQVVYEYQQTPHNAVSNVHVNQQFQTSPTVVNVQKQYLPDTIHSPSQTQLSPYLGNQGHIIQQEPTHYSGVAAPVHHSAIIHHGQGYSKVLYDPYVGTVTTNPPIQHHNVNPQAKYVYANGKITYHPVSVNNPYPGVVLNARPHNLVLNQNYRPTQKPFKPSPVIPITYNRHVQPKQQLRTTESPRKEDVEEEEEDDEKSNVREEQEDEEAEPEDSARYEEEEEEDEGFKPSAYFSKYKYEDEDEDHDRYREDEEDEERSSSSSREVRKKPKKYSKPRQHKNDHVKTREGFKTKKHAEYTAPTEYIKFESSGRKPKSEFKSYKYYKTSNNAKPKKEVIESRESEHIPVVHNKKIVHQEKWLVTKNTSE